MARKRFRGADPAKKTGPVEDEWHIQEPDLRNRPARAVLWSVSGLVALIFLVSGLSKLLALAPIVEMWAFWGHPEWLMYVVGAVELFGAVGLLVPRIAFWAAGALGIVMVGAIMTHVAVGQWLMLLLPILVGIACVFIAWARQTEALPTAEVAGAGTVA